MDLTPLAAALPVAFCSHSNTLFSYEPRDLFAGELFCPSCTARTSAKDRAETAPELLKKFPKATLYVSPVPISQMRPHAR